MQQESSKLNLCWSHPSNFGEILVTLQQDQQLSIHSLPENPAVHLVMQILVTWWLNARLRLSYRSMCKIPEGFSLKLNIPSCKTLSWIKQISVGEKKCSVFHVYLELLCTWLSKKLSRISREVCFLHRSPRYTRNAWIGMCRYPTESSSCALASILWARGFARFLEKQSNIDKQDVLNIKPQFFFEILPWEQRVCGWNTACAYGWSVHSRWHRLPLHESQLWVKGTQCYVPGRVTDPWEGQGERRGVPVMPWIVQGEFCHYLTAVCCTLLCGLW